MRTPFSSGVVAASSKSWDDANRVAIERSHSRSYFILQVQRSGWNLDEVSRASVDRGSVDHGSRPMGEATIRSDSILQVQRSGWDLDELSCANVGRGSVDQGAELWARRLR